MGKRQIKRLESKFERQGAYSKRSRGLLKKAYEIAMLCDIEAALIMYSPTDVLRHFSTAPNIEKVLQRFVQHLPNIPEKERQKFQISEETINRINFAADQQGMLSSDVAEEEGNDKEIRDHRNKLMLLQKQERMLNPGMGTSNSMPAFEERKRCLEEYFMKIIEREQLLTLKQQQEADEALNWALRQRGGQQLQQPGMLVDGMGNPSSLNLPSSSVQPLINASPPLQHMLFTSNQDGVFQTAMPDPVEPELVAGLYGTSDFQEQLPRQQWCERTSGNTQVPLHQRGMAAFDSAQTTNSLHPYVTTAQYVDHGLWPCGPNTWNNDGLC